MAGKDEEAESSMLEARQAGLTLSECLIWSEGI